MTMYCHETEHYIFYCAHGSKAEQEITYIASVQEACHKHIAAVLGISMKEKIKYYFFDSCEELGRECEHRFGEYVPQNTCTVSANEILAVYNQDIHCIGAHEDTHIMSFTVGFPGSCFLKEGVACAMDGVWWGIDNNVWSAYYRGEDMCPSVTELLCLAGGEFYEVDDHIAYPLSGSYVGYLLVRFGKNKFWQFYMAEDYSVAALDILGCTLKDLEEDFFQYIDLLRYDKNLYNLINEVLNDKLKWVDR